MSLPVFVPIAVILSAFWVYFDATQNKIGKIAGETGRFNLSAGGWAAITMGLWIVGFPAYLINRPKLIERACQAPAPANRPLGFVSLSVVSALFFWTFTRALSVEVPPCDAPEVMKLAESVVSNAPIVKMLGIQQVNVKDAGEIAYVMNEDKRTCRAILQSERGQEQVKYEISWHNKSKGQIWLQIVQ